MSTAPSDLRLAAAVGFRHGVVPHVQDIAPTLCDIPGVFHASVPSPRSGLAGAPAGGVGWTQGDARNAAVGEALERYAAAVAPVEAVPGAELDEDHRVPLAGFSLFSAAQQAAEGFPHADLLASFARGGGSWTEVFSLPGNDPWWVPRFLVSLADPAGHGLATSSGLAAASSPALAMLRATQEIVERDALMTVWNHSLPGRPAGVPEPYAGLVGGLGGQLTFFDITPAYSPHPVALAAGWAPRRGRPRMAVGAACRSTWAAAVDKAFLEWGQGVLFAGFFTSWHPDRAYARPEEVTTFEDHAAYYTVNPREWARLPVFGWRGDPAEPPPGAPPDPPATPGAELQTLVSGLTAAGIRLFYRDLTTADLAQIGIPVVRVLSPDLTPIHCEHRWPFLGGRAADVAWRYPWAPPARPNPFPHPLG